MAKVQKPTDFNVLLEQYGMQVFELARTFKAVDDKGRYLHWDEFRRYPSHGISKEAAWAAIKLSRACGSQTLELRSECASPFSLYLTEFCAAAIHGVEQMTSRLGGAAASSPQYRDNAKYLVDSLMMEEAISSAQLEGASTTRKIAKDMLAKERTPQNDDERMILNNYQLMKHAKYAKADNLSVALICEFQAIATAGVEEASAQPGHIRDGDDIFVGGPGNDVVHQPPKASLLVPRLEALCRFANEHHDGQDGRAFIHPLVKAIILHFMLGYEHPFRDGNGRTARCLFYWFMLRCGYWPFEYISISTLLKQAPMQYGRSYVQTETDGFDLTYFVIYQLRVIERAIKDFMQHFENMRLEAFELTAWVQRLELKGGLNYRQSHLLKKVLQHPGRIFTPKELTHDYDVSENTARTDLERLVGMKVLMKVQEGKSFLYIARDDGRDNLKKATLR
ncbi:MULTISPECIES: Fic family protein [Pseudomonas]|uniref:Fic family protein n=1 Tax=Pseudomonas TaxID=286 RepID=UPI000CFB8AA2|nr:MULTISPECIES: Fic family protein [Pseudomonas]PQZ88919.1 cell filamentation protein Fic [Pseudomonas trivialis]PRB22890.1 cell filamentation protein Fic [Pseudomonas sp. MYb60]